MKDIFRLGGILTLVTVVAASGLAAVYSVTKPLILEQKRLAVERALTAALPMVPKENIKPFEENGETVFYIGFADSLLEKVVGYAFVATGEGYSGTIRTMVGIDTSGHIKGMKVLEQTETPGLGTKIEEIRYGESSPWFTDQFLGKSAENLAVNLDGGEIQAITGATISSRALTKSVVEGYEMLLSKIESER